MRPSSSVTSAVCGGTLAQPARLAMRAGQATGLRCLYFQLCLRDLHVDEAVVFIRAVELHPGNHFLLSGSRVVIPLEIAC